ncbi:eukaryotic initiation factor 4E domain-containing protein [Ditylenchus destructor]|nr:eukaryotic initiation factor 4E domain-containing protein [Ditylenchus destructor]
MAESQPFQQQWIMWKMLPSDDEAVAQIEDPDLKWSARLSECGTVTTMAHLWSMYNDAYSLENSSRVVYKADFYLFKDGIKPEYNIAPNINGGRWRIKLKRKHEARFHQMLDELLNVLASNSFDSNLEEYICGVMATIGYESHTPVVIYIWVKEHDSPTYFALKKKLISVLNITEDRALYTFYYEPHKKTYR